MRLWTRRAWAVWVFCLWAMGFQLPALAQNAMRLTPLWSAPTGIAQSAQAMAWLQTLRLDIEKSPAHCGKVSLPPINGHDPVRAFRVEIPANMADLTNVLFLQEPIASTFAVITRGQASCATVFHAGRGHTFGLREFLSPYPNMVLPPLGQGTEVLVLIQDPKAIRPWVRLAPVADFQRATLLVWMMLAAFCAVLLLVIVVVLSFSGRNRAVTAYATYVGAFLLWMVQNFGMGAAWLPDFFPPSAFTVLQAVSVAGVVLGIGWTIVAFLGLQGLARLLLGGGLMGSACGFISSIWWPKGYSAGALMLAISALIAMVLLVRRLRHADRAIRLFAMGLAATVVGGGTQALSVVVAGSEAGRIAVYAFTLGSFVQAMFWLAAITTRLRDERVQLMNWRKDELEQQIDEATEALKQKKEIAEEATRAKSDFLAAASHDLRQPTHALGLLVTRLGQFPMDQPMRQVQRNLEASTQAMQDLLDDLMDYTRLDVGTEQMSLGPVSLGKLMDSLRSTLVPMATAKGLRLKVRHTDLWGVSDPVLLHRMLMNLALNAIRYTPAGTVFVACRRVQGGQKVRIEVWDSGIGIAPQHHKQVFKEFFQVGNAARDRGKGIGLGLSIVQRSAQLLGHGIELRSALGCGSRLAITLPASPAGPLQTEPQTQDASPWAGDLTGLQVLLVEDDALARLALAELLTSWGCVVRSAGNGSQAQNLLCQGPLPGLIVSDYRLGGDAENGIALMDTLRTLAGQNIPACLISGDMEAALMHNVKAHGLTLLHKPVRPAKLRSLIRRLTSPLDGDGLSAG